MQVSNIPFLSWSFFVLYLQVPASVRVRRESVLPKPKAKPTTTMATNRPPAAAPVVRQESSSSSSAPKPQSIDDSYMAFLEDMKALGALDKWTASSNGKVRKQLPDRIQSGRNDVQTIVMVRALHLGYNNSFFSIMLISLLAYFMMLWFITTLALSHLT